VDRFVEDLENLTMTTLYSLRTDPLGWRTTKFDDGEPKGSYIVTERECECFAGLRPSCRHRQMLPQMLAHGIANTHWFMDWDRSGSIVDFNGASKRLYDELAAAAEIGNIEPKPEPFDITATEIDERMRNVPNPLDKLIEPIVDRIHELAVKHSRPWRRL
jgi:hypothetical protein